jgi:hypothetical protein
MEPLNLASAYLSSPSGRGKGEGLMTVCALTSVLSQRERR